MYDFRVIAVARVVDGDTVDAYVDIGFRATLHQRIRLAIVDTPERGQVGYDTARLFLGDWLRERAAHIRLSTYKEDSFGRWIGDFYDRRNGDTASAALLAAGLATVWA